MLTFIILIVLIGGFFIGLRRGLVYQIVHLTGFVVALIVAWMYYDDIATRLRLWIPYPGSADSHLALFNSLSTEDIYYRAIAFAILFFGVKILWHILGSMLDFLANLPLLGFVNRWLGGAFGFIEVYLLIFLFLYFAAILPIDSVQHAVSNSVLAQAMVEHTPVFSDKIKELWIGGGV